MATEPVGWIDIVVMPSPGIFRREMAGFQHLQAQVLGRCPESRVVVWTDAMQSDKHTF
ncbi:MAG: hypothetical protein QM522_08295 [Chitinophagaceae bacterium]|nr:hypothetical protein [Chitinophagaceae bacterium]